eukprot:768080-Hanusia_phi.AAC.6
MVVVRLSRTVGGGEECYNQRGEEGGAEVTRRRAGQKEAADRAGAEGARGQGRADAEEEFRTGTRPELMKKVTKETTTARKRLSLVRIFSVMREKPEGNEGDER